MNLLNRIKKAAQQAISWLLDEQEEWDEPSVEYDSRGRLVCQALYVPVGEGGQWLRCDRYGNPIPSYIPSRIF